MHENSGPSCSRSHVPGYINHSKLKDAGKVFVVSVNDPFVYVSHLLPSFLTLSARWLAQNCRVVAIYYLVLLPARDRDFCYTLLSSTFARQRTIAR